MADSSNITSDRLDMTLDQIIKVKNKEQRKKSVGTRTSVKRTSRVAEKVNNGTRRATGARSQAINKTRGITPASRGNTRRRPTYAAVDRAKFLTRRALQRTQSQGTRRQAQNNQTQTSRNRNASKNTPAPKPNGLRITVTNNSSAQGSRNTTGRLRKPINRPTLLSNRLGTRSAINSRLRVGQRRPLPVARPRTNLRRNNLQSRQAQLHGRLSRVRQTNQARTANVVAQRRGIRTTTNSNANQPRTLNDRFSQQGASRQQARRVVSYGNNQQRYRNNNGNNNNNSSQNNRGGRQFRNARW